MPYFFHDLQPSLADFGAEVLAGLRAQPKSIAPKFFYDERGSQLFEAITELPEYYPTRTEIAILERYGEEIAALLGPGCLLIELGSGSTRKIRVLLETIRPRLYVPIDISGTHLRVSALSLAADFPDLAVHAVCADYTRNLRLPVEAPGLPRAAFYPGSSIGNFHPPEATALLRRVAALLGPGGILLVGVDLQKDRAVLEAAYDDAQGVTAAFNLNLLVRINRELDGDFDLERFRHRAVYAAEPGRIEMHLDALVDHRVRVAGVGLDFAAGESLHTENSYKYTADGFLALARDAGYAAEHCWIDPQSLFSVHALRVAARG